MLPPAQRADFTAAVMRAMIYFSTNGEPDTNTDTCTVPKLVIPFMVVCDHAHEIAQIHIPVDRHLQPGSAVRIILYKDQYVITFCKEVIEIIILETKGF